MAMPRHSVHIHLHLELFLLRLNEDGPMLILGCLRVRYLGR